ncbi:VIR protein [Plasmodium vivax]|uniref:VIR protein n=1 Tax=Plasmodium vivax TaxID=5855 RepID=A0A1G4HDL4_PLAVI|nr:VIR protein [Plasmodium vivax]
MSNDITSIANWKDKYSFLNNVLKAYDEFDSNGDIYTKQYKYLPVCKLIMSKLTGNMKNHEEFCMKLIRNLGHYDMYTNFYNPSHDRCHILYNWIYNTIESTETPNELINKCFEDYTDQISKMGKPSKCSYDAFNSLYLEPRKITILKIFDDNIRDIIDKLNEEHSSTDSPSKKFVCECVKIYRNIYNSYCAIRYPKEGKAKSTCDMLTTLKNIYDSYLLRDEALKNKIPSLDADDNEYSNKCISQAKGLEAAAFSPGRLESSSQTREVSGRNRASFTPLAQDSDENTGGSMSPTVSTALGTVAGASSLLALLYKFTPAKRLVHSGFGGNRRRISNNLYAEGPSELLFDGMEHNDFNSYTIGYEAI